MWLPLAPRMLWAVRCHEGGGVVVGGSCCSVLVGGAGVAGARAVWRWSAAQGLRALGRFVDAGWQDSRAVHDSRGPCSERAPSWQDLRAVYPPTAICGAFRMHGAHILPKPAHFGYTAAICCHELAIFPPEAAFGMHGAQNLPRIDARERISRAFCHRRAPGNASRHNLATTGRPRRTLRAPMRRSATTPCSTTPCSTTPRAATP